MAADSSPEREEIKLKDPAIAAFLAWVIPGLGHFYQGRTAKGILFSVCILGTFLYGCYLGGSHELGWARVVYFKMKDPVRYQNPRGGVSESIPFPYIERLEYLCQIGVGLPAMPALLQAIRVEQGNEPILGGLMAPPRVPESPSDQFDASKPPTAHLLHSKLHRFFELGTVYTMVAGLLNILAIFDAFAGPVILPSRDKKSDEEDDEAKDEKKSEEDDEKSESDGESADGDSGQAEPETAETDTDADGES